MKPERTRLSQVEYYLSRARAMPPRKLAQKIIRRALWEARTTVDEFRELVRPPARTSKQALAAPACWRAQHPPGLFLSAEERQRRCELLSQVEPASKSLIVAEADRICDHVFDLLGSGPRHLGEIIDWHVDFKTGHRFNPRGYFKRIRPAPFPGGYDIKVPWELARCQHLVRLGQAWRITRDEKYAREIVNEISQWIESNPYPYGVNWVSSMEAAIRAVNWLWGLALVIDSSSVDDKYLVQVAGSLLVHGQHIMDNLERPARGYAANHYLANLVGLVYLGISCPFFRQAADWLAFGTSELWKQTLILVSTDGVSNEGSIPYHRFVTEMLVSAILLCMANGIPVPSEVMARVQGMLRFIAQYTQPDGVAPIIGDQDNGRLHRMGVWAEPDKEWVEHCYLLGVGAALFPRNDLLNHAPVGGERIWLCGGEIKRESLSSNRESPGSCAFPASGFYILRHQDLYLIFRVGTDSHERDAHAHDDFLSFGLYAYDKTFITDTGMPTYTGDYLARNHFRSSRSHNVLVVDEQDSNSISPFEPFRIGNDVNVMASRWETGADYDLIEAEHSGYQRLPSPVRHRRSIYFDKGAGLWLIRDDVLGTGHHQLALYYHFAPMDLRKHPAYPMVWTDSEGANLGLYIQGVNSDAVCIEEGCVSPSYGVAHRAPVVKCSAQVDLPYTLFTVLYPLRDRPNDWAQLLLHAANYPWRSSAGEHG